MWRLLLPSLGLVLSAVASCSYADGCEPPKGWHLDRLDQEQGLDACYRPNVVPRTTPVLYVIDSGIYAEHEEFVSKGDPVINGYNFFDDSWDSSDCSGHGSHVAALAAGRTFGVAGSIPVDIVSVRMLDCEGRGSCSGMIKAMDWVYKNHTAVRRGRPGVVVMSVGSKQDECMAADIAAEALISANILVIAAAGNEAIDACTVHPASSKNTLAVAAVGIDDVTSKDVVWSKSNYGKCVSVYAPGQRITSAGLTSPQAQKIMSGTSMAAPMIAGQSLLIMAADPSLSVAAVREIILSSATHGSLGAGDPVTAAARIAHVPWEQMRAHSDVKQAGEADGSGRPVDHSYGGDIVEFDVETTTQTDPPMQYVASTVASRLTSRLTASLAANDAVSTECCLSPEAAAAAGPAGSAARSAGPATRPLLMRCEVRTAAGRGRWVASLVAPALNGSGGGGGGGGGPAAGRVSTPAGAPVALLSVAVVAQSGTPAGGAGDGGGGGGGGLGGHGRAWAAAGGAAAVVVAAAGAAVLVYTRRARRRGALAGAV